MKQEGAHKPIQLPLFFHLNPQLAWFQTNLPKYLDV
jgi:hypothetical protein